MSKGKKMMKRLDVRRRDYDRTNLANKPGYHRPGSNKK